jgi:hypothetical protein
MKKEAHFMIDFDMRKPLVVSILQRSETLQPGLEFDNSIPLFEGGFFECISCISNRFFFPEWSSILPGIG